jgi:hypothetical protein
MKNSLTTNRYIFILKRNTALKEKSHHKLPDRSDAAQLEMKSLAAQNWAKNLPQIVSEQKS